MLLTACEQFLGKKKTDIHEIALHTLEGHQRAIMGSMTVEVSFYLFVYMIKIFNLHIIYNLEFFLIIIIILGNLQRS